MLIGNKNCDKCGSSYDIARDTCPACNAPNQEKKSIKSIKAILFLPPEKQLVLVLIGFGALQIIGYLLGAVLDNFLSESDVLYHVIINVVCYTSIAIGMSLLIFKDFKLFGRHLSKPIPYVAGLTGGIILIMVTLTYSFLLTLWLPIFNITREVNANQALANNMMVRFPITSILVIGILGPICEEFTYRLGMYSFLRRINKYLAYAVTIIFFAVIHIDFFSTDIVSELIALPQYIFAGFTFCLLYEKWGIGASVTAHITNNLFSVFLTILQQILLMINGTSS